MKLKLVSLACLLIAVTVRAQTNEPEHDYEDPEGYEMVEGDILVPKGSSAGYRVAWKRTNQLWPGGVVPYTLSNKLNSNQKRYIDAGLRLLEKHTCVRFVPRTNERSYVNYINGNGCYSLVGRVGGAQPLSLGLGCQEVFVTAHETMHALGIFHEQSRPDRDDFVTMNWANIPRQAHAQFERRSTWEVITPRTFDFKSIMLYDPYIFSSNGRPTMTSKVPGKTLLRPHQKPQISEGDIELIRHLYKCPADGSPSSPTVDAKVPVVVAPTRRPSQPSGPRPVVQPGERDPFGRKFPFNPFDDFSSKGGDEKIICPPGNRLLFGRFCIPNFN